MIALALCVLAFVTCYWAGRRSLGQGLVALLTFGYLYGILRANLLTAFSHFIFDAGMLGLYASFRWSSVRDAGRSKGAKFWTVILMVWPAMLLALPFQPILISLVGFRGATFFVPILFLGSRLKNKDLLEVALGLAALDVVAMAFAVAEYFMGVPRFYPVSAVTQIIYASHDVTGGFFRIPATFGTAAGFGGTMVSSIPFMLGLWAEAEKRWQRIVGLATIPIALMGILMSASRSSFIFGCVMVGFLLFKVRTTKVQKFVLVLVICAVGGAALRNARFQRFKSLDNTGYVEDRIAGSVNLGFFDILVEYPMGNGLGGGGTSIPYFLAGEVRNPIGMENEYARILAEQGIIGLMLWLGFVAWFFHGARHAFAKGPWGVTRKMTWCMVAIGFGTAWIGLGLLTAIPGTLLLMLGAGWTTAPPERGRGPFANSRVSFQNVQRVSQPVLS